MRRMHRPSSTLRATSTRNAARAERYGVLIGGAAAHHARARAIAALARRAPARARRRRLVVDDRRDERDGRRLVDEPRHARLVPRGLGRDDGRDDAAVGVADGHALLADAGEALPAVAS